MNLPHVDPLWDMKLSVIIAHTIWWMSGLLLYILLNKGANYWECCASVSKGNTKKVFVVQMFIPKCLSILTRKRPTARHIVSTIHISYFSLSLLLDL